MSYWLSQHKQEHVVLERTRVAERWHSERWNSLCFQFPNWALQLPGYPYAGTDPDGFAHRTEVARYVEDYAGFVGAPLRCAEEVHSVHREAGSGRYLVSTRENTYEAKRVVIATGPFQRDAIPACSARASCRSPRAGISHRSACHRARYLS
jgi:putative flavoprotein involved in K+ transport